VWLHRVVTQPGLARRLGTVDAVIIGLGSMLGAGVFAAFSPAAAAAGAGLLIGLALAALVAYCNATASAQLAAQYPTSGGTYIYGRERLGPWWGFLAGWGFVVGKIASCAAMALTFAVYLVPSAWIRPVAIAAVIILAAVNYHGITRTAALTKIIIAIVLATLALVVIASLGGPSLTASVRQWDFLAGGWYGILQSAGLLFFAFAGYARIATLGEEVRDPERTIPRAILIALGVVVLIYLAVAVSILIAIGRRRRHCDTASRSCGGSRLDMGQLAGTARGCRSRTRRPTGFDRGHRQDHIGDGAPRRSAALVSRGS
jgi:APA family basic amino acid/polyamine antiporter